MISYSLSRPLYLFGLAVCITTASCKAPVASEIDVNGLFGTIEIPSNNLDALPQWSRVIDNFDKSRKAALLCDKDIQKCTSQQMTLWRAKIQELEDAENSIKIREINKFINKWRRVSDFENYDQEDYWATPLEFITFGGDSEDFAIMKYISLRELGISASKMRIVVTNDVLRGVNHTILSVHSGKRRFVLDSQNDTVLQEQLIKYYVPFYSVNETTRWAHVPRQAAALVDAGGVEKND